MLFVLCFFKENDLILIEPHSIPVEIGLESVVNAFIQHDFLAVKRQNVHGREIRILDAVSERVVEFCFIFDQFARFVVGYLLQKIA